MDVDDVFHGLFVKVEVEEDEEWTRDIGTGEEATTLPPLMEKEK